MIILLIRARARYNNILHSFNIITFHILYSFIYIYSLRSYIQIHSYSIFHSIILNSFIQINTYHSLFASFSLVIISYTKQHFKSSFQSLKMLTQSFTTSSAFPVCLLRLYTDVITGVNAYKSRFMLLVEYFITDRLKAVFRPFIDSITSMAMIHAIKRYMDTWTLYARSNAIGEYNRRLNIVPTSLYRAIWFIQCTQIINARLLHYIRYRLILCFICLLCYGILFQLRLYCVLWYCVLFDCIKPMEVI